MAKKETPAEQPQEQQPAIETTKKIVAPTRDELFAQVDALKASLPEGARIATGAAGFNAERREYTIRVDIIPAKP
jgi:hypothetical protein